jgi:hypothetical protein
MIPVMGEHTFSRGWAHGAAPDLLSAAILHHLLRGPAPSRPGDIARAALGRDPGPRESAHVARAIAGLMRDGLVERAGEGTRATRAARAFHRLLISGP